MDAGQRGRYFASGLEAPFGDVRIGTAMGYAESISNAGSDRTRSKLMQAAAYGSMPIGGSAYVGAILAAESASVDSNRLTTDTVSMFRLSGATRSTRYVATAEAGFRSGIGHGLSVNPRAQLGYSRYTMNGFYEQGGETALQLNRLAVNRLEARLGAKLDGTAKLAGWTVRPQIQADYVRLVSGSRGGMKLSFAAAPDYAFALPLTNGGSGWMEMKGGLEMSKGKFSLGLTGQATVGDAPLSDQRGLVNFTMKF
jgi:outer membrane autotransporter protein